MRPLVLGLDLGTTEAKAGLFDLDGGLVALEREAYPTRTGPDGRAEQDPADWWDAIASAVRRIAPLLDAEGASLEGICGVAQGPTLAVLDASAAPIRPAVTWQDRRARDEGFGLMPKLAWLAREDPDAGLRATWLSSAWDALGLWLSGTAAATLQRHERPIDPDLLVAAGIDPRRLPPPLPVGGRLGRLGPGAADRLGLRPGIPVVAGVNDGFASMLGAGLLEAGDAVDTGGASGGFGVYVDRAIHIPGVYSAPAPLDGLWVAGGAMAATGASVDWFVESVLGGRWTLEELLEEAATAPVGSGDLVFLPYLAGERAPVFDESARGAFVGLTLAHERRHLARAVLEGAAFAIRHVAAPILEAGVRVTELRLAGGPSRSDLWARIKADVTGFRVALPAVADTAVLGAAILAAHGVGLVPDLATGVRRMTRIERRIDPDPGAHARYSALFDVYRSLYPSLAPAFAELARIEAAPGPHEEAAAP